jgi:hypothetical protein
MLGVKRPISLKNGMEIISHHPNRKAVSGRKLHPNTYPKYQGNENG